jgi:prepilin-type N-terminal cleavage/methylation domain-containing protein
MGIHCSRIGSNKGFTLLELIVVSSILGIICLIIVPNLSGMNEQWILRSTAYMLANDIRRIQSHSIKESSSYKLDLYTNEFYYRLKENSPLGEQLKLVRFDSRIADVKANFNKGTDLSYGLHTISYNSTGAPDRAGTVLIKSRNGYEIRVTVDVATGRVRVYE